MTLSTSKSHLMLMRSTAAIEFICKLRHTHSNPTIHVLMMCVCPMLAVHILYDINILS